MLRLKLYHSKHLNGFSKSSIAEIAVIAVIVLAITGCSRSTEESGVSASGEVPQQVNTQAIAPTVTLPSGIHRIDWSKADTEEYLNFVKQLRSQNIPEDKICAMVLADVNRLFQTRLNALAASMGKYEYWRSERPIGTDPERRDKLKKQAELLKKRWELLAKLGVTELPGSPGINSVLDPLRQMFSFLSPEKTSQIIEIEQKYQRILSEKYTGTMPSADRQAAYEATLRQKEQELTQLLSPQEKADYDLRLSTTARKLRDDLQGFNPSEQEFRDLYGIKKQYEERIASLGTVASNNDSAAQQQIEIVQREVDAQIRRMIGEDRYVDYQRCQDIEYRNLLNFADTRNLPQTSMASVYETQKSTQTEAQQINESQNMSQEQRAKQLADLRAKAEKSLVETLGTNGYNIYRATGPGQWLKGISSERPSARQVNPKPLK